jgi:hypothetical protein
MASRIKSAFPLEFPLTGVGHSNVGAEDHFSVGANNQGAFLLGKAVDIAERAPGLAGPSAVDPREGIAATTFYDQLKAFFRECSDVCKRGLKALWRNAAELSTIV